jgi:hypothetical protein
MTIDIERLWAVNNTMDFLFDLAQPHRTPRVPKAIRQRARRLLKHYPSPTWMWMAGRELTKDKPTFDGSAAKWEFEDDEE